jgi:hypothetical protein
MFHAPELFLETPKISWEKYFDKVLCMRGELLPSGIFEKLQIKS